MSEQLLLYIDYLYALLQHNYYRGEQHNRPLFQPMLLGDFRRAFPTLHMPHHLLATAFSNLLVCEFSPEWCACLGCVTYTRCCSHPIRTALRDFYILTRGANHYDNVTQQRRRRG